ncbi:MAG: hypothetical protein WCS65_03970 [Verrucomicrobiae bacterium]
MLTLLNFMKRGIEPVFLAEIASRINLYRDAAQTENRFLGGFPSHGDGVDAWTLFSSGMARSLSCVLLGNP